ncbi:restriction endonuclease subunit S [Streptomyces maremycinicus]|uniref:restriction endonuclease subunit S n=1 Tax=Streptomyces maremycinicus TaxID=1679753 RepID=UPI0007885E0A|nr:restriction endonuclease subunit S [Streptomyces sp. NBRC 110468]
MSRIDDLIVELCPNGVEHKALGEVGEFARGNGLQKSDLTDVGTPAIHYGQIHTYYGTWAEFTKSFTDPLLAARLRRAAPGDLVIATTSEDDEAVAKATAWLGEGEVAVSGDAYIYRHTLDPKYVAYFFQSQQFQDQKKRGITGAKVRRVSGDHLAKIRIPVPPSEIQVEIVSILDKMSYLQADLEAELELRSRQYAHYRDSLLTFVEDEEVRWTQMGDVTTIVRGASPRPIQAFLTDDAAGVPWIKIGDVPPGGKYITGTAERVTQAGAEKSRMVHPGDFVLSNSMSFGRPYISKIKGAIHDGWLAISGFEDSYLPDFLYHLLRSTPLQADFKRRAGSSTVSNLNAGIVRSVLVPVPSLEVQERIVGILDKFDALVNVHLPAELKARQTQYEYYLDKLLAFKEAVA